MTNQLLAEAEALPELDEYDGLSATDIAHAVINWPGGSEDQIRAIAALRRLAPDRHHNRPPLAERLDEELAALKGRADAALATASTAVIVDSDSAGKVITLGQSMKAIEDDAEALRKKLQKPYQDAIALIKARVAAISDPVKIARQGVDTHGGLRLMLRTWDDKVRAEAEAERLAAEEEQRKREAAAEAARARVEEAATAGQSTTSADLAAADAAEQAERARQRAEAIRPAPIRSDAGQVGRSRTIEFTLDDDLLKPLRTVLKLPGGKAAAAQFLRTWFGKYLRSLGVEVVQKGVSIPGITAKVVLGDANVRR